MNPLSAQFDRIDPRRIYLQRFLLLCLFLCYPLSRMVPVAWGCCGYAGDRGMLHPELTASATAREAAEVAARPTQWYVSSNRTCELGMQAATGKAYRHVLELMAAATRPSGV